MKFKLFINILFFILFNYIFADSIAYNKKKTIQIEDNKIIVIHFHDWSSSTLQQRISMINGDQNPFTQENNYAYLKCIDKKTGKTIFKKPSSAISKIFISEDSKYILCLSNLKIYNPYQLILYYVNGEIILKKHISVEDAKLSHSDYSEFRKKYPCQNKLLELLNRITYKKNSVFITYRSTNMPIWLGEAWDFLIKKEQVSIFSNNFDESVSNWIFWYKEPDPMVRFQYENFKLVAITILDPLAVRFSVPIIKTKLIPKSK